MNDRETGQSFAVLIEECARIRGEWQDAYCRWQERESDELAQRCTELVREMAVVCMTMQSSIRRNSVAVARA